VCGLRPVGGCGGGGGGGASRAIHKASKPKPFCEGFVMCGCFGNMYTAL
jgi:hypothetical protein